MSSQASKLRTSLDMEDGYSVSTGVTRASICFQGMFDMVSKYYETWMLNFSQIP